MGSPRIDYQKTAIFLSVRDKATRLPNKVARLIKDKRVIEHLIDRLKRSIRADMVVLTTSINVQDAWLEEVAITNGIFAFRGSEDDKLARYLDAANQYNVDFCVVVDGDDLFCDPGFIDRIIEQYYEGENDYIVYEGLSLGVTGFGVKKSALEKVVHLKAERDTEVWGSYFTESNLFDVCFLTPPTRYRKPEIRMTLDYIEDLNFFEKIFDALYTANNYMSLDKILHYLDNNPEVVKINREAQLRYETKIKASQLNVMQDVHSFQKVE